MISYDGGETLVPIHKLPAEERARLLEGAKEDYPAMTADEANQKEAEIAFALMYHPTEGTMSYVGWGGTTVYKTGKMSALGFDYGRGASLPRRGLRRAAYDFCYGYVSGFEVRHIIWYIFTRSLNYRKRPGYLKKWEKEHGI